jgi:hypothetical protein
MLLAKYVHHQTNLPLIILPSTPYNNLCYVPFYVHILCFICFSVVMLLCSALRTLVRLCCYYVHMCFNILFLEPTKI